MIVSGVRNKETLIPMIAVQVYLGITLLLYAFGPWRWRDPNMIATVLILVLIQIVLFLGFGTARLSIGKTDRGGCRFSITAINVIVLFGFAITLLQCVRTLGTLDPSAISRSVSEGLTDAASQYSESKLNGGQFGGSFVTYFIVLIAPISWMAIPLSLYYFKRLAPTMKVVALLNIVLEVSRWLAIGTNKGVFDVFFVVVSVLALKTLSKKGHSGERLLAARQCKRNAATVIVIVALAAAVLWVFSNNVGSRVNGHWENYEITNGNTQIDPEAPLMVICPEPLRPTLILASSYLTQGYYAFSLSRLVEWVPLFGMGNSMFLMENFQELTGVDVFQMTYQARLEQFDWDPLVNWHSFYVWAANDVGPIGTFFIIYFIGYLFYQVSYDAITERSDLAIVLFCLFCIMFFYLPANNQVLSYPSTFMTFWVLLAWWKISRRRRCRDAEMRGGAA